MALSLAKWYSILSSNCSEEWILEIEPSLKRTVFKADLLPETANRVRTCDNYLMNPARLQTLAQTGLMGSGAEPAFDRLAHLAAKILQVPLTIVSLVSDKTQFFKAGYGLPAPYDTCREIPIDDSICRYTLAGDEIIAADTTLDPLLMYHPTTEPWGIAAFIAIPMITASGHVLGAFCAVDTSVRHWSEHDIIVMRELTTSVMTEIELRMKITDLEIERGLRDQFVATLTHDLRAPLSVVKMSAEILGRPGGPGLDPAKLMRMISENIDRADLMIRDLLNVSSMKAGERLHVDRVECDLATIARSALEDLTRLHGARFAFEACEPSRGLFDPLAMRRVIENLVSNAVKYGSREAQITIRLQQADGALILEVHNHGNPLDEATRRLIFEPYRRSSSAIQGTQKGWGLGLALVRGFVEAHDGKITVDSSPATGTVFRITCPVVPSATSH